MGSYIVLATNTNHQNSAYGPFSSFEDAQTAKFELGGRDRDFEHQVLQLFDHEKPLPTDQKPLYEQDMEKVVLHDMAVEAIAELPPFEEAEQPDAPEEDEVDPDAPVDLGSAPAASAAADDDEEDERTLADLRAEASVRGIAGRSSMSRDELIAAIEADEED